MLSLVALVDQWQVIQSNLPEGWSSARLRLTVRDDADCDRAAALLGPANPGRRGKVITFGTGHRGMGPSPELVRRLIARLDRERIRAVLELARVDEPAVSQPEAVQGRRPLHRQWDALVAELAEDWSDLYAEIELFSTDYLERAALLLAPVNPSRVGDRTAFRFRGARRAGYGVSPQMTRRCLERLDGENVRGTVRILWALSDTKPVYTQGPVWYVGGRAV